MATGPVSFLETAKYGGTNLAAGVVETLIQESPILEQLMFTSFSGNATEVELEDTLPTPQFRSVGEGYTRSYGTDTSRFFGVAILGGEVFIDNYQLKVQADRKNAKAKQYSKFTKAMSRQFDETFLRGDATAKDFKGVNTLIGEGLGSTFTMSGTTDVGVIDFEKLDQAQENMRGTSATAILAPQIGFRRNLTTLARNTAGYFTFLDTGTDAFGRKVTTWDDIPIRVLGDDINGDPLLPYTEDPGDGGNDGASIYFVRYGDEENVYGLLGLDGSMDVQDFGETESLPGHLGRVEVYPGIAIKDAYSVVRIQGVKNATS